MSATIYIWLACVNFAWATAPGPVAGYVFQVLGGPTTITVLSPRKIRTCFPGKHTDYYVRVRGYDATMTYGPWSPPRPIHRVHDHDADGDRAIGWDDFRLFVKAFQDKYLPNGVVTH